MLAFLSMWGAALEASDAFARVRNPPLPSDLANLPGDLRAIPVPRPAVLEEFVRDERAAIVLGKALFWDMQVGSDGVQACASCHFVAGADPRSRNQVSPGLNGWPNPDHAYATGGPNHQLTRADFPLTRLAVAGVRGALGGTDSNDVVGSQGVHYPAQHADPDGFRLGGANARRVEPRNAPSVINAVFNHRQFWDGRADAEFNGVNHLGSRDPQARVMRATRPDLLESVRLDIDHASLASQALAPVFNDIEMAQPGRTAQAFARELTRGSRRLGQRLTAVRPLAGQLVSRRDSVLGAFSAWPRPGLRVMSYDALIKAAFQPRWWLSARLIQLWPDGTVRVVTRRGRDPRAEHYSLLQYNFPLFFGLAVQLYEATLVADDSPWDRFRRAHPAADDPMLNPWINTNPSHISRLALYGAHLFNDRTRGPTNLRCSNCHEGPELTDASVRRVDALGRVRNRDGNVIDRGYNNIGIRPVTDDPGTGGQDAFGPFSYARRQFPAGPPATLDGALVDKGFGLDGAMKIPGLRNVALTAPYFRNGDVATLRDAVALYSRGGNIAPIVTRAGTPIEPLGMPNLSEHEIDALVAWLESLTDERVRYRRAPFDHPQLFVPNGHPVAGAADADGDGLADDLLLEIPAVGAEGGAPLPRFLEGPFGPQP